jgi:signal transduction histidine kinase
MPSDPTEQRRAVIVDADSVFADALAIALRDFGYQAQHATPETMHEVLESVNPNILLWDIEASEENTRLLAELAIQRPGLMVLPMASRPDRRRLATVTPATRFINKSLGIDSALSVIQHSCSPPESASSSPGEHDAEKRLHETKSAEIEFLAKISHELRTPLNAIIGFSELIIRNSSGPVDQTQQRAFVEDIHASGRHLLEVINDILDFARAESGKLVLQESESDIAEVFASINRVLGPQIRDAGLELRLTLPKDLPRLWCDELKLKRVLLNLMTNAAKATPTGGRIDVEAAEMDSGMVITVTDTGVGIAKRDLKRVLEPFVQVENSLNRRHEGSGLGLPLVKAMVEIHGGRFELESELRKGTTVRLTFPSERVAAPGDVQCGVNINSRRFWENKA